MSTGNINDKLKQVLYELLNPTFTVVDDTCLEKILQHVSNEINAGIQTLFALIYLKSCLKQCLFHK